MYCHMLMYCLLYIFPSSIVLALLIDYKMKKGYFIQKTESKAKEDENNIIEKMTNMMENIYVEPIEVFRNKNFCCFPLCQ